MQHDDPEMIGQIKKINIFEVVYKFLDRLIINLDGADCKIFNSSAFSSRVQLLECSNVKVLKNINDFF